VDACCECVLCNRGGFDREGYDRWAQWSCLVMLEACCRAGSAGSACVACIMLHNALLSGRATHVYEAAAGLTHLDTAPHLLLAERGLMHKDTTNGV